MTPCNLPFASCNLAFHFLGRPVGDQEELAVLQLSFSLPSKIGPMPNWRKDALHSSLFGRTQDVTTRINPSPLSETDGGERRRRRRSSRPRADGLDRHTQTISMLFRTELTPGVLQAAIPAPSFSFQDPTLPESVTILPLVSTFTCPASTSALARAPSRSRL